MTSAGNVNFLHQGRKFLKYFTYKKYYKWKIVYEGGDEEDENASSGYIRQLNFY